MEINVCIYLGVRPSAFASKVNLALLGLPFKDISGYNPSCGNGGQCNDDNNEDYSKSNSI